MAVAPGVRRSELGEALRTCRNAFIGVGVMSCAINVLYLTGSIFMLEVYDRVLPSRSVPTLVGLLLIAIAVLHVPQCKAAVDTMVRSRLLAPNRQRRSTNRSIADCVFDSHGTTRRCCIAATQRRRCRPLRDLDTVRGFIGGMRIDCACFDLPWTAALYSGDLFCYSIPLMGLAVALIGAVIVVVSSLLAVGNLSHETAQPRRLVALATSRRNDLAAETSRASMPKWSCTHLECHSANGRSLVRSPARRSWKGQQRASDRSGWRIRQRSRKFPAHDAAVWRCSALGAYLVINQQATAGVMHGGDSILSDSRALAPIELAIAQLARLHRSPRQF